MRILLSLVSPALIMASSALLAIRADSLKQTRAFFLFKPLTTIFILAYACLAIESLQDRRGLLIITGLFMSLLGDIFLLFPKRFLLGLASFLLAHLLYLAAFFTGLSISGLAFFALPLVVYGGILLMLLWKHLVNFKLPVTLYILTIMAMLYQAGERYLSLTDLASLITLIGAGLFVLSDTFLALNKFRKPFQYASFMVLGSYYSAQWLIALSLHLRFR